MVVLTNIFGQQCEHYESTNYIFHSLLRPLRECECQLSGAVVDGGEGAPPQYYGGPLLPQRLTLIGTRRPLLPPHLAVLRIMHDEIGQNWKFIFAEMFFSLSKNAEHCNALLVFGIEKVAGKKGCSEACYLTSDTAVVFFG